LRLDGVPETVDLGCQVVIRHHDFALPMSVF
jgi:hypothetical protein